MPLLVVTVEPLVLLTNVPPVVLFTALAYQSIVIEVPDEAPVPALQVRYLKVTLAGVAP